MLRTLLAAALVLAAAAAHADEVRRVPVQFAAGTSAATIRDHVQGSNSIEYRLAVRQGQTLKVTLESRSTSVYFNVWEPGVKPGEGYAVAIGEQLDNKAELVTAHAGEYMVQVFLVRAVARRNERADFTLHVSVTGGAQRSSSDALVPGTSFHATGTIPCAHGTGQPMGSCSFGVRREGGGAGSITVSWAQGATRVIRFKGNAPSDFDHAPAEAGATIHVSEERGLYRVRIGTEHYEIPREVMTGG